MSDIKYWSTAAASNTMAPPNGAPEGWNPNQVNDWARETMAAVRRWYDDAQWIDLGFTPAYSSTTVFTIEGDKTDQYHADRRVRCAVGAGTYYGYIQSAVYNNPNTTVTVALDSGALDSSLSSVSVGIISAQNSGLPRSVPSGGQVLNGGDHSVSSVSTVRLAAQGASLSAATLFSPIVNTPSISAGTIVSPVINTPSISGGVAQSVAHHAGTYSAGTFENPSIHAGTISGATLINCTGITAAAVNVDGASISGIAVRVGSFSACTIVNSNLNSCSAQVLAIGGVRFQPALAIADKISVGAQTIADITIGTKVTFDTTEFVDQAGWLANGTYTPLLSGYIRITAQVKFDSANIADGEELTLQFMKNGATFSQYRQRAASATNPVYLNGSVVTFADGVDDYFEIYVSGAGGASNARTVAAGSGETFAIFERINA